MKNDILFKQALECVRNALLIIENEKNDMEAVLELQRAEDKLEEIKRNLIVTP